MPLSRRTCAVAFAIALSAWPAAAFAQPVDAEPVEQDQVATKPVTADAYVPITTGERVHWIVDGTIGPQSLFIVGPLSAAWQTAWNTPEEWGRSWSGVGKRYAQREADVAISNTIEAGLGALWGEDPRYIPSARKGIWPRARYALKTSVLAQGRDGRLRPAWGRYAGNTLNNIIENAWLPPSQTTAAQTAFRSGMGIVTRMGGNLWDEFWPDVVRLLKKRRQ
ncbi:MAG TPA: hypothetical protein VFI56_23400 [Vicinamibacterales bacterium]|jgi:hypothetical protein|nr:hypothetical protein [Vicinamibacterales bacterium]